MSEKMSKGRATWRCEEAGSIGPLYYVALNERRPAPYTTQRHVKAIIDMADDGTLAGIELVDDMPPPPMPHILQGGDRNE